MSGLQFQSFTNADFSTNATNEQGGFSGKIGDKNQLVDDNVSTSGTKRNFFSFAYYQQFFDVDTEQVTKRLMNSAVPTHNNFIADFVQPIPDLYGPFWVCVTLVFSIGIFSNIAQYIENEGGSGDYGSDFRMVTGASSLISTYVLLVPFLLYSLIWYRKSEVQYSFLEILCAYGYSLTIFVPVSILWTFDLNWFRWALIFTAVALSGTVLAKSLWPAFKNDSNKMLGFGVIFGVMFLHFCLALAFKEYFFDAVHAPKPALPPRTDVEPSLPPALPEAATNANVTDAKLPAASNLVGPDSVVNGGPNAENEVPKVEETKVEKPTEVEKKEIPAAKPADVKEEDKGPKVEEKKEKDNKVEKVEAQPAKDVKSSETVEVKPTTAAAA